MKTEYNRGEYMARVARKNEYESIDSLLRRFKKAVDKDNVLDDYKKHDFYEKPSVAKKKNKAAAVKRWKRKQIEMDKMPFELDVR